MGLNAQCSFATTGASAQAICQRASREHSPGAMRTSLADRLESYRRRGAGISASWLRRGDRAGHQLDDALREAIKRSLVAAGGDCSRAAAMAGVSRETFQHKMVRYGLIARGRGPAGADERDSSARLVRAR